MAVPLIGKGFDPYFDGGCCILIIKSFKNKSKSPIVILLIFTVRENKVKSDVKLIPRFE
ncbi:hypothetical protein [Bacillus thuringiensis]|uniref:hypothetical protein n=1 Tax=Bacillus thuringiensis TaxID=1428 RepID=UPI0015D46D41|nr:hypothetical protein [Bacillus thuringiensis]